MFAFRNVTQMFAFRNITQMFTSRNARQVTATASLTLPPFVSHRLCLYEMYETQETVEDKFFNSRCSIESNDDVQLIVVTSAVR